MVTLIFGMIVLWLGICMGLSIAAARSARRQAVRATVAPVEVQPVPVPESQG
jgi:hypothetical protein